MLLAIWLWVLGVFIVARLATTRRVTRSEIAVAVAGFALVVMSNWLGDDYWFAALLYGGIACLIAVFSMNRRPAR